MSEPEFDFGEFNIIAPCGCEYYQYRGGDHIRIDDPPVPCAAHTQEEANKMFERFRIKDGDPNYWKFICPECGKIYYFDNFYKFKFEKPVDNSCAIK